LRQFENARLAKSVGRGAHQGPSESGTVGYGQELLGSTEAGCVILEANADRRATVAAAGLSLWINSESHDAGKVTSALLRANQKDWTASRLAKVVQTAAGLGRGHEQFTRFNWFPYKPLISAIESAAEREGVSPDLCSALEKWRAALMPRALTPEEERELGEAERISSLDVEAVAWAKISDAWATKERLQRIRVPLTEENKLIERLSRVLSVTEKSSATEQEPVLRIDSTDAVGSKIAADVAKRREGVWSGLGSPPGTCRELSLPRSPQRRGWLSAPNSLVRSIRRASSNASLIGSKKRAKPDLKSSSPIAKSWTQRYSTPAQSSCLRSCLDCSCCDRQISGPQSEISRGLLQKGSQYWATQC